MTDRRDHLHSEQATSLSGLSEAEAKEFHGYFVKSFLGFLGVALLAHFLTYAYAPWGVN